MSYQEGCPRSLYLTFQEVRGTPRGSSVWGPLLAGTKTCLTLSSAVPSCSVVSSSLQPNGLYVAHQAPLSMGILQTRILEWVGHALLQGIFPTQESNQGLLHCRWILYHLCHQGSPWILEWIAMPASKGSSQPRNRTRVSCIAGGFFTR